MKNLYKYTPGGPPPLFWAHADIFVHSYRMNSFQAVTHMHTHILICLSILIEF